MAGESETTTGRRKRENKASPRPTWPGRRDLASTYKKVSLDVIQSGTHWAVVHKLISSEYPDTRRTDSSSILKTGPRQEITGPLCQDRSQPSAIPEIHTQAHHAAEYNRSVNRQSEMRTDYTNDIWRRPHEQPVFTALNQPVSIGTAAANIPMSHATQPPYTKSEGMSQQQSGLIPIQSSQPSMTAPPFSTPIQAQNPSQSSTVRYVARVPSQPQLKPRSLSSGFTARMLQMWPPTPQASQNVYTHNQQAQQSLHPPQSPMPKFRHLTTAGSAQQGDMPYFGMPEMAQGCPAPSPCDHQTQGQYMHKGSTPSPAITQAWSGQQQQGRQQQQQGRPEQWWTQQPQ
jgi:chromatin structure-remodeling complex protein RSC7